MMIFNLTLAASTSFSITDGHTKSGLSSDHVTLQFSQKEKKSDIILMNS